MFKKNVTFMVIVLFLLVGMALSAVPVRANDSDKLQRILQITSLPAEIEGLKARLDRGQLVYGLPTDIPNNDWKPAPPDADGNDWQRANGINLGRPGQEPRYLGKTADWSDFSNDWFPDDAPDQVIPAQRDMISEPWLKRHCEPQDSNSFSDYTWSVIAKTLQTYHNRIGFSGAENSFANNPAFQGDFSKIRDYFKVLAEPKPGLAGTVRHWHYRGGAPYYDTITVRWDILPDFIVESIDPGVPQGQKAQTGQTYTGKVVVKAKPDASFLSDPQTRELFMALVGGKKELPQDYAVPFGVAVNGRLVPVKNLQPMEGLNNVYWYNVKGGKEEDALEVNFDWTANGGPVKIGAAVNTVKEKILPQDVWNDMDWSELTNVNNTKFAEVQGEIVNLKVTDISLSPDPGEPGQLARGTITVKNESEKGFTNTKTVWRVRHSNGSVLDEDTITTDLAAGESKQLPFGFTPDIGDTYSVAAMINPMHDNPPNEVNWLSGDWPGDNRKEVSYLAEEPCTDISVQLGLSDVGVDSGGSLTAYVTVRRANDGPNRAVPVNVTLTTSHGGRKTWAVNLDKGRKAELQATYTLGGSGEVTFRAEAWPQGVEDCYPGNNRASERAWIDAPPDLPAAKDRGIFVRLIS